MIRAVSAAMVSLLLMSSFVHDAVAADREKGQVHFEPFEFSVPGKDDYVYFTLFVVPTKQSNMLDLCKMEPRVRDVVNEIMHGRKGIEKLGLKNRFLIKASTYLRDKINQALPADWANQVFFVRGAIELETGPVENPTIPRPLSCKQISFQAKGIRDLDAE